MQGSRHSRFPFSVSTGPNNSEQNLLFQLPLVAIVLLVLSGSARAQTTSFGDRLFHEKADCQFCHGVNGDGHGDPYLDALVQARLLRAAGISAVVVDSEQGPVRLGRARTLATELGALSGQ